MYLEAGDYYSVKQIADMRGVTRSAIYKHSLIEPHIKKVSNGICIVRLEDIKGVENL